MILNVALVKDMSTANTHISALERFICLKCIGILKDWSIYCRHYRSLKWK